MLADEEPDDLERRRRGDREPIIPRKPIRQSCLGAGLTFIGMMIMACLVFVMSCTSSCRPRLFGTDPKEVIAMDSMNESKGLHGFGAVPRSTHELDAATGELLRSRATGEGFSITWKTPAVSQGAVTEEVLDATLSRMQSMQRNGLGGDTLARHIFSLDKLLEEMRRGDFTILEKSLGRRIGSGLGDAPASTGAGFPARDETESGQ